MFNRIEPYLDTKHISELILEDVLLKLIVEEPLT